MGQEQFIHPAVTTIRWHSVERFIFSFPQSDSAGGEGASRVREDSEWLKKAAIRLPVFLLAYNSDGKTIFLEFDGCFWYLLFGVEFRLWTSDF